MKNRSKIITSIGTIMAVMSIGAFFPANDVFALNPFSEIRIIEDNIKINEKKGKTTVEIVTNGTNIVKTYNNERVYFGSGYATGDDDVLLFSPQQGNPENRQSNWSAFNVVLANGTLNSTYCVKQFKYPTFDTVIKDRKGIFSATYPTDYQTGVLSSATFSGSFQIDAGCQNTLDVNGVPMLTRWGTTVHDFDP